MRFGPQICCMQYQHLSHAKVTLPDVDTVRSKDIVVSVLVGAIHRLAGWPGVAACGWADHAG